MDACKDNYDEKKYIEMANNSDDKNYYLNAEKEYRPRNWESLRHEELIPFKMEFNNKKVTKKK